MAEVKIINNLLPYNARLKMRDPKHIKMIVLHSTETPTLELAREYGGQEIYEESSTGNAAHYYIDLNGGIYRYVEDNRIAFHVVGYNEHSIGIEIVNKGRFPNWFYSNNQFPTDEFRKEQITTLLNSLKNLKARFPGIIRLERHSALDQLTIPAEDDSDVLIRRRIDPGPQFPWEYVQNFWNHLA
jgi:N-acetylmuramoyl-L-alanine amidase